MEKRAVSRKTLRQRVYEDLRAEIISGDIFPGQNLTLRSLSEQYDVSIVPIREALFQLAAEGVIVQRNNRDYRVATLTPEQFDEIYRIRELNELFVAKTAYGEKPPTAESELRSILDGMKGSLDNPAEYIRFNQMFHFTLYSYARMPTLINIIRGLWARVGPYLSIHIELLEDLTSSHEIHTVMLERFLDGSRSSFMNQLKMDLDQSYGALGPIVKKLYVTDETNFREHIVSRILTESQDGARGAVNE